MAADEASGVAEREATTELDAVAGPVDPGAVATVGVSVAEAPLVAGYGEGALVAPVAVAMPGVLAVSDAPLAEEPVAAIPVAEEAPLTEEPVVATPVVEEASLTEGPVAATAETEEAPAVEAPAVEAPMIPLATEKTPDAVCATEAVLVADTPEIALPDEGPAAVAGRLAVPVWDAPEIAVDAPVPAPVRDTVFETPDNGADPVPVAPRVLLSPLNVGTTEPCVPLGTEAVDCTTPEDPITMLELDPALDKPDVGRRPETTDACVDADGMPVLPPAETTPDGPKTILEPVDDTGAAVGAGTLNDDAGAAVWEPVIELIPAG